MKKHQATRNGQYIGEPKADRPAAQQVVCDDMEYRQRAYNNGWISKTHFERYRWHIIKVRG